MADSNAVGTSQRTNANVRSVGAVKSRAPYRGHRPLTVIHTPVRLMATLVSKNTTNAVDQPDARQYDRTPVRRWFRPPR